MNDKIWTKKIIFLAMSISFSACLQIYQHVFIYWRYHFFAEPWRWWTAHWVHVGWVHFFLNAIAFICLPFIFPRIKIRYLVTILFLLPLLISFEFYYFYPHIEAYAGLSGVLHGLYTACAIFYLQFEKERRFSMLVLIIIGLKIAWENIFGSSQTAQLIGSSVLVEAHFLGAISGSLIAGIYFIVQKEQKKIKVVD